MNKVRDIREFGFTLIELMIVVAIISVLFSTAFQFYEGYVLRSKTQEVYLLLPKIVDGEVLQYQTVGNFIELSPVNIPPSINKVTGDFSADVWKQVRFSPASQIYFGYQGYTSGADFVCEAQGDLNGDGDVSIFSVTLTPTGAVTLNRGGLVYFDELE
ncbi:MAG: hypothetical protein COV44_10815 [Deltaproteobacteria bacterium CG11_big_fil_rev_8_21_14_0_20_45_16]|nr:MAG: hypothetical protein COV44_10815 [Deltaproteobacteria bacterium CG11_big_fil_rev_8_21_14_0_20_45_16]